MSAPTMIGLELPDVATWSDRVVVALGQNPSVFTGPGTNTYLIGTGPKRILLDPGQGLDAYLPVLDRALSEAGCTGIQEIVLTHGHPDHIGGVASVLERHGEMRVSKRPWPENDTALGQTTHAIDHGDVIRTEGATLRAVHTPGHAPDHLCFILEEEQALFSGDNVLGVGTTVIPNRSGDLGEYLQSLQRMLGERPKRIYPAHGPCIADGEAKIREYIAHREERERQILAALADETLGVMEVVRIVYAAYPAELHAAAAQSTTQHLRKLEAEGRVTRAVAAADAVAAHWRRT